MKKCDKTKGLRHIDYSYFDDSIHQKSHLNTTVYIHANQSLLNMSKIEQNLAFIVDSYFFMNIEQNKKTSDYIHM